MAISEKRFSSKITTPGYWPALFAALSIFFAAFAGRAEILPIKTYTSADGLIYEGV